MTQPMVWPTVLVAAVSMSGVLAATTTSRITLREGGNFSISMPDRRDRVAFDLVGGIWVMDPRDGQADALTANSEYSRHPAFSPDGQWIAYESVQTGFHQIMLIDAQGGTPVQATHGDYHHLSPQWSPGGATLVFASDRAGNFDVWQLDLETSNLRQLTFDRHDDRQPIWNADGTLLAFVRDRGSESSLMALRPGEKPTLLVTENAPMYGPAWRPGDDRVLTYVRQHDGISQLRMLLLSRPAITKPITHGETVHPYPVRWIDRQFFLYAADGRLKRRQFGVPSAEDVPFTARVEIERDTFAIRKRDFDDISNRPVTGITGMSPTGDGRLIVSALGDIWELSAAGTLLRQLTNDAFVDSHPAVSPDGSQLAYISDKSGNLQIWLMDIETRRTRRLTSESGAVLYPAWNPASDSLIFLVAEHPASASLTLKQIAVADRNIRIIATRLTNSAPPVLNADDWSVPLNSAPIPDSGPSEVPLTWRPFKPEGRLIIRAGRIFDGLGPEYLLNHEIVIQDNRIAEVRPWTSEDSGARVIDATEHAVIPGLIDLSARQAFASGERLGRTWLAFGVTTIRETVSNLPEAIERQESWRSGRRIGPRLFVALNPCAGIAGHPGTVSRVDKVIAGTAWPNVASIELCPGPGTGEYRRLIAAAHAANLPVSTPTPFPGLLLGADELRLTTAGPNSGRMLLQTNGVNDDDIVNIAGALNTVFTSSLAEKGMGTLGGGAPWPDSSRYRALFTASERRWYSKKWALQARSPHDPGAIDRAHSLFRAIALGARVVTGSGAPVTPYGIGLHAELRLLARSGLQPFQVLKMASLDAARILGAGDDLGSIQAGKLADLLIIDGDPLSDISQTARVIMTVMNGRPYEIAELLRPGGRPGSVGKFYN